MRVEAAGVALEVDEHGENRSRAGPATVLVHGIGGTDWPLDELPGRVVRYDRRGYGGSGAPEPYLRTTVQEHTEDLVRVIRELDAAPALVVGADLGALVALDLLLRYAELARAAVLLDPPAYMFVPEATEALSERRAALEEELRAGGPAAVEEARPALIDFGAIATLPLSYGELRSVATPVAIVTSPAAPPHDVAAAEALLDAMPSAAAYAGLVEAVRALA